MPWSDNQTAVTKQVGNVSKRQRARRGKSMTNLRTSVAASITDAGMQEKKGNRKIREHKVPHVDVYITSRLLQQWQKVDLIIWMRLK